MILLSDGRDVRQVLIGYRFCPDPKSHRRQSLSDVRLILELLRLIPPDDEHFALAMKCFGDDGQGNNCGGLGDVLWSFFNLSEADGSLLVNGIRGPALDPIHDYFRDHPRWWLVDRPGGPLTRPWPVSDGDPTPVSLRGGTLVIVGSPGMMEAAFPPRTVTVAPPAPEPLAAAGCVVSVLSDDSAPPTPAPIPVQAVPPPDEPPVLADEPVDPLRDRLPAPDLDDKPRMPALWRLTLSLAGFVVLLLGYAYGLATVPSDTDLIAPEWVVQQHPMVSFVGLIVTAIVGELALGPRRQPSAVEE